MLFSSLIFVCAFFPLFFALYYLLPKRSLRNALLLIFSILFYAWGRVVYLPLILAASLIGWGGGRAIGAFREKNRPGAARASLVVSLVLLLGMLGVFKYAGFFVENLNLIPGISLNVPLIELPIGISFYTFQSISYLIDVYRGTTPVQRNFRNLLLYISMFPQLIAGPIVRYGTVAKEITDRHVDAHDLSEGMMRFLRGLGKKVILANQLSEVSTQLLTGAGLEALTTAGAWIGIIAFTFQIYFDFS